MSNTASAPDIPAHVGQPFTILLLRPDYMAATYGHDTYLAHVFAEDYPRAIDAARDEVAKADNLVVTPDDEVLKRDYHVLFACNGHIEDIGMGGA